VLRLRDDHGLVEHQKVDALESAHARLRTGAELDLATVLQRDRLLTVRVAKADEHAGVLSLDLAHQFGAVLDDRDYPVEVIG
jgi:hypothetical protein